MKFLKKYDEWDSSHTDISKYLITRLYQMVDVSEIISYRYPVTNGLILLEELYDTVTSALDYPIATKRLKPLIEECLDKEIKTSIVQDKIIEKYFNFIQEGVKTFGNYDLSERKYLKIIQTNLIIYISTLQQGYIEKIFTELEDTNWSDSDNDFQRKVDYLNQLAMILVSQALHIGHSISFLQVSFAKLVKKKLKFLIEDIFRIFAFYQNRVYKCFILCSPLDQLLINELQMIPSEEPLTKFIKIEIPKTESFTQENLDSEEAVTEEGLDSEEVVTEEGLDSEETITEEGLDSEETITEEGLDSEETITEEGLDSEETITETELLTGYCFECSGKDPLSALRNSITKAFINLSLKYPETVLTIQNLFNPIWKNSYYFNTSSNSQYPKYRKFKFDNDADPIIPAFRINTLINSLYPQKIEEFSNEILVKFQESLYFYHLAHSASSIENSYLLLWTALESLMGFRAQSTDNIGNIKENVARALALGSVGRRVNATIQRMKLTSYRDSWGKIYGPDNSQNIKVYERSGLCEWITWMSQLDVKEGDDFYNSITQEPLLGRQFSSINQKWKKLGDVHKVIIQAHNNTSYQLDRLYQARNKIVHSGQFGRTGKYLWIHLEWYLGKLLAVSLLISREFPQNLEADQRDIVFGCLRGQYESSIDYLKRHKNEPIDCKHLLASGITAFPVLCFESIPKQDFQLMSYEN
jgi:hypothetical protein